jgi:Cell wall-active antibiotics response LiaF, C-terminal
MNRRIARTIMRQPRSIRPITAALLIALLPAMGTAPAQTPTREIGRTTEREINVFLSSSFGTVILAKGEAEKILRLLPLGEESVPLTNIDYAIRNRVGYADVRLGDPDEGGDGGKGSFNLGNLNRKGKWDLRFSDAIPVSFDVELGMGRGDFNLTGLQVKDFRLSSGASDVTLAFDQPNQTRIENMTMESGVSKFEGRNLGNANFKRFRFQGGVGSYTLDFAGKLPAEVEVDVEVGMGAVTIIVPKDVGARVSYEKSWVSSIDLDQDFSSSGSNEYLSENYSAASSRMNIRINAGFGSVRVRRP